MNLFNLSGPFGIIPGCGTCNQCDKCYSNPCKCKKSCAYPEPFIDLDEVPNKPAVYRVNDNGKTAIWDMRNGIKNGQTDTSLVVDIINRLLQYSAERHTDTITAQELGAILHLTDLGDVSTKGAENGAMMVYKQSDNCPAGCYGTGNIWEPFNALDEQVGSLSYVFGFNIDGVPATLQQPANANWFYNYGWNGNKQMSFHTPPYESAPILDDEGYDYQLHMNPRTGETYYTKVKVS